MQCVVWMLRMRKAMRTIHTSCEHVIFAKLLSFCVYGLLFALLHSRSRSFAFWIILLLCLSLSRHVRATTNALFFSLSFGSTIITHIRIQYTNTQQQSNNKTHREINSMVIVWFVSNALDASEHLSGDMVYVDSQYALYTRFVMRIAHIAL